MTTKHYEENGDNCEVDLLTISHCRMFHIIGEVDVEVKLSLLGSLTFWMYSLPSINVNPREWIKVDIYRSVNN